jgi:two-component sensor histidine kinase
VFERWPEGNVVSEADSRDAVDMEEHLLPHAPEAAILARALAAGVARSRASPEGADDFVLVVCEAVTNAVRHGAPVGDGNIRVGFEAVDGVLRGVVVDGGSGITPDELPSDREAHFGLRIIDALSKRWGVAHDGATHAVWFELDLDATSTARAA